MLFSLKPLARKSLAVKTLLLSVLFGLLSVAGSHAAGNSSAQVDSRASIETVFDRNKGQLYRLYRLALKDQPDLKGKIVLEIQIGAAGVPLRCDVKSSQLHAPDLENKLCERIKLFRFDPQAPTTFLKKIEFYPAK
jgi:hypothetical protein